MENGVFTLKNASFFHPHYARETLKRMQQLPFWNFVSEKLKLHYCRDILNLCFKMFSVHTKRKKPVFSNSSSLKSVFEKRDRPNRRNKASFSIFSGRGAKNSVKLRNVRKRFSVYLEMRAFI